MGWILKSRIIGPAATVWAFDDIVGYSCMGHVELIFDHKTRSFEATDDWAMELLPLLSKEERAAAVAAAINPPTDRSLTKLYFNWKPPTETYL